MRQVIEWFAEEMERQLAANDHKGGWQHDNWTSLFARLGEEKDELLDALTRYQKVLMMFDGLTVEWEQGQLLSRISVGEDHLLAALDVARADVAREAADVANFALMIADNIARMGRAMDEMPAQLTCDRCGKVITSHACFLTYVDVKGGQAVMHENCMAMETLRPFHLDTTHDELVAQGMQIVERMLARERCDYCGKPWTIQAVRVHLQTREWLCDSHYVERIMPPLEYEYRIEVQRPLGQ